LLYRSGNRSYLYVVPQEFNNTTETKYYISKHKIPPTVGLDVNELSDDEVLKFAGSLLEQMEIVSYKYKQLRELTSLLIRINKNFNVKPISF